MSALYLWGKPIATQLTTTNRPSPHVLTIASPVIDISCGDNHCVVVTEDGAYGVGDNSEGQLGMRSVRNSGLALAKIQLGITCKIIEVSCGWHHTLLLDETGNAFSSGRGDSGELGRESVRRSSSFGFVLSGVKKISAGKDHSLAICGTKVYGWGNSKEGQLGLLIQRHYYRPQELNVYPCQGILAGSKYSLFVTSKGVFGTGLNDEWQLGLGHSNSMQVPRRLAIEEGIVELSGGSYCAAQTNSKEWYLWGVGVLGSFRYPTKMSFLNGADSVSISQTAGMFSKKGRIWVWGQNSWGELGHREQVSNYPVQSEEFSRMGFGGFAFGLNFFAAFSNCQPVHRSKNSENSYQQSEFCQNVIRNTRQNMKNSRSSDSLNQSPAFDRYINVPYQGNDLIRQSPKINRRLYSEERSICEDNSAEETSYDTMFNTRPQTPKGWQQRKYVKLVNPIKTIQGNHKEILQKQNRQLRERLEFERYQKQKIEQEYMKRINRWDKSRLMGKIQKLQSIAGSPNQSSKGDNSRVFGQSRRQPENISFRPRLMEGDDLQAMGDKIQTLKLLISELAK